MKLINPSFGILEQGPGLQSIYKQIELAGRTCYKSLDKITDDSAEGFVNRMVASKHYAMLEHGTVYLKFSHEAITTKYGSDPDPFKAYMEPVSALYELECRYGENPYSKINHVGGDGLYVTTNLRVLVENEWLNDLEYLCEPTEHHEKRVTVRFTTSNGIMREFTRHRSHSFAVESTRYCNYSKEKFDNGQVTFIIPSWAYNVREGMYEQNDEIRYWYSQDGKSEETCQISVDYDGNANTPNDELIQSLFEAEYRYLRLIGAGKKPQEAREVLPLATKCDMVMTGFISDWEHFFDLRSRGTTGAPHPDAKALADPLMHEFENRQLI